MGRMKVLVVIAFVAILGSLGSALFYMMRDGSSSEGGENRDRSRKMARALALRVGFSVLLFICILIAWKLGWIQPTGIRAGT